METRILDIIAYETSGKSYKTYKYCFDSAETSSIDYDDNKQITWKKYGETVPPTQVKDMKEESAMLMSEKPLKNICCMLETGKRNQKRLCFLKNSFTGKSMH